MNHTDKPTAEIGSTEAQAIAQGVEREWVGVARSFDGFDVDLEQLLGEMGSMADEVASMADEVHRDGNLTATLPELATKSATSDRR